MLTEAVSPKNEHFLVAHVTKVNAWYSHGKLSIEQYPRALVSSAIEDVNIEVILYSERWSGIFNASFQMTSVWVQNGDQLYEGTFGDLFVVKMSQDL